MKILLIFLLALPTCIRETLAPDYDIVLCVAQSNGVGLATIETQDSGSGAWLWNNSGWEKADGTLNRYANIGSGYGLSMFNAFGKEAAKHSRPYFAGLVVNAKAGSTIQAWKDSLMILSIQRTQDAFSDHTGNRITAILMQQGESHRVDPEVWLPNVRVLRRQVDSLIGYNVPMIFGGVSPTFGHTAINDTIKQVVNIHDCYYVSSDSLTTTDGVHFDSPSQREFGLRFYHEYAHVR